MPADRRMCVPSWLEEKPVALSPITIPDCVNISAQCAHGREKEELNPLAPVSHWSKGCSMEHYHPPQNTHFQGLHIRGCGGIWHLSSNSNASWQEDREGPVSMRQELLWVMPCW